MEFKELIQITKRLFRDYVKKYFSRLLFALSLSLVVAGSTAAIAWLLDPAVKKIFIDKDTTYAYLIPILIIIAFSTKGLSLYFARINVIKVGSWIQGKIQKQLANKILLSDIQTLEKKHSGKYVSNILYDATLIQNMVSTAILNLMKDSFTLIALLSLMFYQNWRLALFAIIMMPLSAALARTLGKRIGKATKESGVLAEDLTSFLSEIIRSSQMIRIFQTEKRENLNALNKTDAVIDKSIKIQSILIRATPIMEILTGIMIAGFIFFSGVLIAEGELEINNFFSFLTAMMLAYQPIRSLATINMVLYSGAAGAKRVFAVLDEPISIANDTSLPKLEVKKSDIIFKDVSFKYDVTTEKAVSDINFEIKGGTMAAFVGHSGAGKSTIIKLIPRFYDPQKGKIFIDNQDIHSVNLESLRKNIALVSQDVILFDSSIKDNIAYANPNASDEEIVKACQFAAADDFINKMPNKYNTLIGENGVRLSGGQKQRISIARAVLKNSPIILLDEATSSLDAESEEKVQSAIKNLTKNKTTLVIAHRLSTIHNADKIFLVKSGMIIDSGNHQSLINSSEDYKSLYQRQLK
ncbi:MAG: ABC transporter permease [Pelagibacterales bacterium MED-G40]|nr:MAG: ABC transporter permease [Candidatus Pelagibacter sp. TMED203]PDH19760.1 MAG: ABC transporter permease [Pelagibacterales bacterium MED-G40]|tara:strand:+ start:8428 stop:10170 length:1743 start_codon:yes stop_codon:yes gene_type:complete